MTAFWLIVTHCISLFPIGCLVWNYKIRKENLFLITRFLYTLFSLLYHSYHVDDDEFINLSVNNKNVWTF